MELKLLHFYPDLMSLYGSYANVSILKRTLEAMGNTVAVERVRPGEDADIADADFIYMGAGTERAQKAALADFGPVRRGCQGGGGERHGHAVCRKLHGAFGCVHYR